ncbi:MAG: ABC transporter ATP-binding protein [Pirellulaceae bacterium]
MALIQLDNLQKSFGNLQAVAGINLEIGTGETLGLLGPNGAGKTTTVNMIIGLTSPDAGSVTIDGRRPGLADTRRQIGLAPQSLSLYEELTARENLEFFGRLYALERSQLKERVGWALEFAGLADRANDRTDTYSGGMKRRLNLACAMIHQPTVVLMDEPTVGVDPQSRNHLFECIEQLQAKGVTIIYTTHYMQEAQRLCDRIAIVDHGKLLAIDTVDGLINTYGGNSLLLAEFRHRPDATHQLAGSLDDLSWRVETDEPLVEISNASRLGLEFQSLKITQPDLESVFLSLTGRSLRD